MINNDILRRLRYALNLTNEQMVGMFAGAGVDLNVAEVKAIIRRDDEDGFIFCTDERVGLFLDGLILDRRGPRDSNAPAVKDDYSQLTNNTVLRKLRIALEYKQADMLETLKLGGMELSPSELSALFRKPGHKHYRLCGDQLLRNFLQGLTVKLRG